MLKKFVAAMLLTSAVALVPIAASAQDDGHMRHERHFHHDRDHFRYHHDHHEHHEHHRHHDHR